MFSKLQLSERFWAKVDTSGEHWVWRGAVNSRGYGNFRVGTRFVNAHRVALWLATGDEGIGMDACHGLACPRLCVRPAHLTWKSHYENLLDVITKHGKLGQNRKTATKPLLEGIDRA